MSIIAFYFDLFQEQHVSVDSLLILRRSNRAFTLLILSPSVASHNYLIVKAIKVNHKHSSPGADHDNCYVATMAHGLLSSGPGLGPCHTSDHQVVRMSSKLSNHLLDRITQCKVSLNPAARSSVGHSVMSRL